MGVRQESQFLNVDLVILGLFDPEPLLAAAGKKVFALGGYGPVDARNKGLVLELNQGNLDLPRTLTRLIRWVQALPPDARRSWNAASRRIFDVGLQGGLEPNAAHWSIPRTQLAAIEQLGAEIAVTLYAAPRPDAPPRPSSGTVPAPRSSRRSSARRRRSPRP